VKTRVDGRLVAEAERFAFRFACDECVHFDAEGVRCSLEYPAAPRRDAIVVAAASGSGGFELCKSFELA
jgi:hypothetical protein